MKAEFVELFLTCGSWQEAQTIADALWGQHLVACVEFMEIKSKYWWQGKLETVNEVKLLMKTVTSKFQVIEAAVATMHSYKTFVLEQIPLTNLSNESQIWLKQEISN